MRAKRLAKTDFGRFIEQFISRVGAGLEHFLPPSTVHCFPIFSTLQFRVLWSAVYIPSQNGFLKLCRSTPLLLRLKSRRLPIISGRDPRGVFPRGSVRRHAAASEDVLFATCATTTFLSQLTLSTRGSGSSASWIVRIPSIIRPERSAAEAASSISARIDEKIS